jgi:hypothetical protein
MPVRRTQVVVVVLALALSTAPGCGSDDESDSISDAETCAELRNSYEISAVTDGDAELIADRLVEIAEADYAEDGVLDDPDCSLVIRDLDSAHASAVDGIGVGGFEILDGKARNG